MLKKKKKFEMRQKDRQKDQMSLSLSKKKKKSLLHCSISNLILYIIPNAECSVNYSLVERFKKVIKVKDLCMASSSNEALKISKKSKFISSLFFSASIDSFFVRLVHCFDGGRVCERRVLPKIDPSQVK